MNRRSLLAMFAVAPAAIAVSAVPVLAASARERELVAAMGVQFPALSADYEYAYGQAIDVNNGTKRCFGIRVKDIGHVETRTWNADEVAHHIVHHDLGYVPDFVPGHA